MRGEYAEDISDPNDPKWVPTIKQRLKSVKKKKKWCRRKTTSSRAGGCHQKRGRDFDVSAPFPPLKPDRKTCARTERDGETPKEKATSRKRLAIQGVKLQRTVDQVLAVILKPGEAAGSRRKTEISLSLMIYSRIYYDIPNEAYHAGPGVSKSQLDDIADTPAIYLWRKMPPWTRRKQNLSIQERLFTAGYWNQRNSVNASSSHRSLTAVPVQESKEEKTFSGRKVHGQE